MCVCVCVRVRVCVKILSTMRAMDRFCDDKDESVKKTTGRDRNITRKIGKRLSTSETFGEEMERIKRLRENDPKEFDNIMDFGRQFANIAAKGTVHELVDYLEKEHPDRTPLLWWQVKAFRQACVQNRPAVGQYFVDNGFDRSSVGIRHLLHEVLDNMPYHMSPESVVRFLLDLKLDVNEAREDDLLTPLHLACKRRDPGVVQLLLNSGADVNAVAKNDLLPLSCLPLPNVFEHGDLTGRIGLMTKMLESRGARRDWRRQGRKAIPKGPAADDHTRLVGSI